MRIVSFLLELVGIAAVIAGVALWSVPAAFVVGGVFGVVVGFTLEPDR